MQPVSETAYLLSIYQCSRNLVKIFFFSESCFSIMVSVPETMIYGGRTLTIAGGKRFPALPVAWKELLPRQHPDSRAYFTGGKAWATQ
jgi:hypothetical protein